MMKVLTDYVVFEKNFEVSGRRRVEGGRNFGILGFEAAGRLGPGSLLQFQLNS